MGLENLKIGTRLTVVFCTLIVITLLLSIVTIRYMKTLSDETVNLYNHPYAVTSAALKIDAYIVRIHRTMKDVVLSSGGDDTGSLIRLVEEYEKHAMEQFDIIASRFLGDRKRVESARKAFGDWKPIREEVLAKVKAGEMKSAADITRGKGLKYVESLEQIMEGFIDFASKKADSFVDNALRERNFALWATSLLFLMSLFLGVFFAIATTRSIIAPLSKSVLFTEAVSRGDLNADMDTGRKDEFGVLARSLREMKESVRTMLDETGILVRSVQKGELHKRGDEGLFMGAWADLVIGINRLVDAFVLPVNVSSLHLERLARGDIPELITEEFGGDFNIIKNNLNMLISVTSDVVRIAEEVAEGKLRGEVPVRSDRDTLMQAMNLMIRKMTQITSVADAVASGDYERKVEVRGDSDRLGFAINRMTESLKRMTLESTAEDWLKTGQNRLNEKMRGELDDVILTENVLRFLADYLNFQVGVCYLSGESGNFFLVSSYAYRVRGNTHTEFSPGEGLMGQAAREKKMILYSRIPEDHDHLVVDHGMGEVVPSQIMIMPLVYEEEVIGVMAFGVVESFRPEAAEFLERVTENIAISLSSARSRARLSVLLEKTKKQATVLKEQQEELKVSNEELEEQTLVLKESEEKLKIQREELQSMNEELEETTEFLKIQKAEVEQKNREIQVSKQQLEQKARDLEIAGKYKSQFLANMSHELRTPLNSLLLLSKMLSDNEEGNLTPEQVEAARVISNGGRDLLNLINDILDLSKIEAGKMEMAFEKVEVDEILDHIRAQFSPVAGDKNVAFKVSRRDSAPETIVTDGQRLEQIVKNLLSNAFKFTKEGSVVFDVGLAEPETRFRNITLSPHEVVAFSVRDTGIGIAQEKIHAIFEAFLQADGSTSRSYGGTGLGLTISRELAGKLGGEIGVESRLGEGSVFSLYLPISFTGEIGDEEPKPVPVEFKADRESREDKKAEGGETMPQVFIPDDRDDIKDGDRTILVIEDDPGFSKTLKGVVNKRGYRFLCAGDGRNGLLAAARYLPDAVILDIVLPDMSGLSVLDELKTDLKTMHIPVHVISGQDVGGDSLRKGAVGFLFKPAEPDGIEEMFGRFESLFQKPIKELLVVEDDENSRNAVTLLVKNKGINITGVGSGGEALERISETRFDCVILDLGLPDMTGFQLLEKLERQKRKEGVELPPIIIYTGRNLTREEHRELSRYSGSIVIKGAASPERLLMEVSLFLHSVESAMPEGQKKMIRMLHDPESLLSGKKVLLVDDDMRNMFALSHVLGKYGIEVVMADNGRMALEKLDEDEDIDLVLMDVMMPVMDGLAATREIRKQGRFDTIPVIALTAKAMPEDRAACIESGASDYLMKPVDAERLISMMRIWLFNQKDS